MTPTTMKAARAGLDWTQDRLASEAGIHAKSVARWERGVVPHDPKNTPITIRKLADAFARNGVVIEGNAVRFTALPCQ